MYQLDIPIQTQMLIVACVTIISIIISFILLIISGLLMIKVKRLALKLKEQEQVLQSMYEHQFLSPKILPFEELGRRGFFSASMLRSDNR